ncbi:unnamed protein product, partial [Phaeothamnion confervicola]
LSRAYDLLFELYDIHDFYFSSSAADKEKLLRAGADRVLDELRPFCGGDGLTPKERAKFFFVRGRTLDVFSWYSEEAAACLTRAVKLNPAEVDAWNALGHCFWKKGDLKAARECFLDAIAKRPNAKSLQQLSMLLRQLPASGTELKANVQESVLRAKEALALGLRDGDSWYALGNAHATQFFRVTHAPEDLDKALQAFARAVSQFIGWKRLHCGGQRRRNEPGPTLQPRQGARVQNGLRRSRRRLSGGAQRRPTAAGRRRAAGHRAQRGAAGGPRRPKGPSQAEAILAAHRTARRRAGPGRPRARASGGPPRRRQPGRRRRPQACGARRRPARRAAAGATGGGRRRRKVRGTGAVPRQPRDLRAVAAAGCAGRARANAAAR